MTDFFFLFLPLKKWEKRKLGIMAEFWPRVGRGFGVLSLGNVGFED